jgi:hypothetical protein
MTSIVVRAERTSLGQSSDLLTSLEPALSLQTREIARRIQALQNQPSLGSPSADTPHPSTEKPLHENLFDALAAVKVLTSQVAMHLNSDWRAKLFHQLDSLHDPAEWEEGDLPVQQASFATFLKAMLTINPAAWTTGMDRLTIEFMLHDRVRWVLSLHYEDGLVRYAGDAPVTRLAEGLAKHDPEHWFSRAPENREHP